MEKKEVLVVFKVFRFKNIKELNRVVELVETALDQGSETRKAQSFVVELLFFLVRRTLISVEKIIITPACLTVSKLIGRNYKPRIVSIIL